MYTYEEIRIKNSNAATRLFISKLAEYLLYLEEIVELNLYTDRQHYRYQSETFNKKELASVCKTLADNKKIKVTLRTMNGESFRWKVEDSFLGLLDDKLKKYVIYRATEYSDYEPEVGLCIFDVDGLRFPDEHNGEASDIEKWYCHTPEIVVRAEDEADNQALYESLKKKLDELKTYCDAVELYEDEWKDCGEFEFLCSISFHTRDIPAILRIFQSIHEEIMEYESSEFSLLLCGVPDGENDYDFAKVRICMKPEIKAEFVRI